MQRRFVYFINPISGTANKDGLIALIQKKTAQQHIPFEILHTNKNGNYAFLAEKIHTEKITDIIICGGDGTVSQIASFILKIKINVGIIPMGSGNGLAFAAGIKKKPSKALDIIFAGKASFIDSFYINKQFSCMLCGLGFDAQVAHDFAKQPTRGLATYIKQTVKNFFKAETYCFTISANDTTILIDAFFISIANSNQFGNNVTIAPKASLCDGLLDIVVVNKMSKTKMVYTLLKQIRLGKVKLVSETKYHNKGIHYFQTKKLTIKNKLAAPLHIDGDPAKTDTFFDIEIIENAFRLLQP
jgi:YegS/Rv2252/BmrU family lipid kinase